MPPKLIILFGFPGCGKSTLATEFLKYHSEYGFIDVFIYVQPYKDSTGNLTEEQKRQAHEDTLNAIEASNKPTLVEFSTNHPELIMTRLGVMDQNNKNIRLVFCTLDKNICIDRALIRAMADTTRIYPSREYLEKKFNRPYPQLHEKLAQENNLSFQYLDMDAPVEVLLEKFITLTL